MSVSLMGFYWVKVINLHKILTKVSFKICSLFLFSFTSFPCALQVTFRGILPIRDTRGVCCGVLYLFLTTAIVIDTE